MCCSNTRTLTTSKVPSDSEAIRAQGIAFPQRLWVNPGSPPRSRTPWVWSLCFQPHGSRPGHKRPPRWRTVTAPLDRIIHVCVSVQVTAFRALKRSHSSRPDRSLRRPSVQTPTACGFSPASLYGNERLHFNTDSSLAPLSLLFKGATAPRLPSTPPPPH